VGGIDVTRAVTTIPDQSRIEIDIRDSVSYGEVVASRGQVAVSLEMKSLYPRPGKGVASEAV